MFTKNWYAMIAYSIGMNQDDFKNIIRNMEGNDGNSGSYGTAINLLNSNSGCPYIGRINDQSIAYSKSGVIIGSGTTAPTINDYALESRITTPLSSSGTITTTYNDNSVTHTSVFTITNNHTEEITISEIGIFNSSTAKSGEKYAYLLERTVLETPITISSGGVGQVTYTITINLPTA